MECRCNSSTASEALTQSLQRSLSMQLLTLSLDCLTPAASGVLSLSSSKVACRDRCDIRSQPCLLRWRCLCLFHPYTITAHDDGVLLGSVPIVFVADSTTWMCWVKSSNFTIWFFESGIVRPVCLSLLDNRQFGGAGQQILDLFRASTVHSTVWMGQLEVAWTWKIFCLVPNSSTYLCIVEIVLPLVLEYLFCTCKYKSTNRKIDSHFTGPNGTLNHLWGFKKI
jgi:hypothetical protein